MATDIESGIASTRGGWLGSPTVFAIAAFVVVTGGHFVIGTLVLRGVAPFANRLAYQATDALLRLAVILLPTLLLARYQALPARELFRLRPASIKLCAVTAVASIALWFVLSVLPIGLELSIPGTWHAAFMAERARMVEAYGRMLFWRTPTELVAALLLAAVVVPVAEEFLFRGLIQRTLERTWRPAAAVIVTSALFTAIHMQIFGGAAVFIIGAYLGVVASRARSIVPSVVAHAVMNGTAVVVLPATVSFERAAHTTADLLRLAPWVAVAFTIFFFSIRWIYRTTAGASPASETQ